MSRLIRETDPELRAIERELMAHRYLYYVESEAVISDYAYDMKERDFRAKCSETSPMMEVGSSLPSSYTADEIELAHQLGGL